jgi:excisionase family DNA binding protein
MSQAVHPDRRWMSLSEAANYTGLSTKTLRRRIEDGTLTGYRAGPREIRLDRNDIDAMFEPVETGDRTWR